MSFCDFKGIWRITAVDDDFPTETKGHWIAIGGTPGLVKVICLQDPFSHTYGNFAYQEEDDLLQGIDSPLSTITWQAGSSNVIAYNNGLQPGSWTADDNLG